ncbi:MAG: signal recognition particle-docking protein FtsY [Rickettsiaceae bacterium]|nr:signal recognition particle-docking protein FtsY [Rickettsiaceae bacterium]
MSFFSSLKSALSKTASAISSIGTIFTKKTIDLAAKETLEEILLSADFGFNTTEKIIRELKDCKFDNKDSQLEFKNKLQEIIFQILNKNQKKLPLAEGELNIILFCGVNGNGKTTSIGKLANFYKKQNKKVLLAACDTFRSAAIEQLEVWGQRSGCFVVKGPQKSDPASVAYKAVTDALEGAYDVLIIDTAGRLQNNQNLMSELTKINNVVKKAYNQKDKINIILTLDATTGQNASIQVEKFSEIAEISGLIFTKIDGSAKGGAIVGICDKYNLPVFFLCSGEGLEDIFEFGAEEFSKALIA